MSRTQRWAAALTIPAALIVVALTWTPLHVGPAAAQPAARSVTVTNASAPRAPAVESARAASGAVFELPPQRSERPEGPTRAAPVPERAPDGARERRQRARRARMARLVASPLRLAAQDPVDLEALADARAAAVLPEQQALLLDSCRPRPVRAAAATALSRNHTLAAEELLRDAALRGDPEARALAARALEPHPRAEVDRTLTLLLNDPAAPVRCAAGAALGARGATTALLERLERELDPQVRAALALALLQFDPRALAELAGRHAPCGEAARAVLRRRAEQAQLDLARRP